LFSYQRGVAQDTAVVASERYGNGAAGVIGTVSATSICFYSIFASEFDGFRSALSGPFFGASIFLIGLLTGAAVDSEKSAGVSCAGDSEGTLSVGR
jgi:hypothetical protein